MVLVRSWADLPFGRREDRSRETAGTLLGAPLDGRCLAEGEERMWGVEFLGTFQVHRF